MKIDYLDVSHMRNDAHFQFHREIRDVFAQSNVEALKIAPLVSACQPLFDREDEALKKIVKSEFTAKIHEADKARDEIWAGLTEMNSAALRHFSPDTRRAAERLKILFDTYGNIASKPVNEESSAVYNILQDLRGKYAADIAATGAEGWVAELEVRNAAVERLVKDRFSETAARCDIILKEARAELDAAYFAIRKRVNALVEVDGAAAYEQFIKALNAIIAKYKVKKHRHAKIDAEEAAGEAV
jgi:hypothetical protein